VAQGEGPELKHQYRQKKKKNEAKMRGGQRDTWQAWGQSKESIQVKEKPPSGQTTVGESTNS
jgi:hypothetical protein